MGYIQDTHTSVHPTNSRVHTTAPLGFNLLEQLTELRKTVYLHLTVSYEGYNSGTAKLKRCIRQDVEGGGSAKPPCFTKHTTFSACQCSPAWKISESLHGGVFSHVS